MINYKEDKRLKEKDILFVRRGSYRIGSVAMVSPFDLECVLTREILVIRIAKPENKYGVTPYYLLYALSHKYTFSQIKSKVFLDTTLPNIADRWKELKIPIYRDKISNKKYQIKFQKQWMDNGLCSAKLTI